MTCPQSETGGLCVRETKRRSITLAFRVFPHLCPEPVLAKRSSRFSQEEDRKVGKERKKDSRRERDFFACTPTCRDLDLSRVDATEE
jgi:hypothetical protein